MEDLQSYGALHELKNTSYKLHPFTNLKDGGMELRDDEGIVKGAVKELVKKVSKKAIKG